MICWSVSDAGVEVVDDLVPLARAVVERERLGPLRRQQGDLQLAAADAQGLGVLLPEVLDASGDAERAVVEVHPAVGVVVLLQLGGTVEHLVAVEGDALDGSMPPVVCHSSVPLESW